jgi:hypothetical protein
VSAKKEQVANGTRKSIQIVPKLCVIYQHEYNKATRDNIQATGIQGCTVMNIFNAAEKVKSVKYLL